MLMLLLKKKGIECKMAVDGVEALAVLQNGESTFDIVFMDNMYCLHTLILLSHSRLLSCCCC